ncbi:glutamate synthase subunit beta [Pusillimonas sp. CC-YST705]|uniref:Glutamate synthase subunit beta n=1 Tax=Mesopusillimonas faecipullorum TaxID=2755040 RepID=A0ABS8CC52_9BURK|nr:glutamate synthase subunit beta [Mesopusillimonas faecipullorum]MCB5363610.1 glutamate synthase subunit beta [Mesopusillimonas faecipullorum]
MGKPTGFIEYARLQQTSQAPLQRLKHWREFVEPLDAQKAGVQGARCMDCGIPFCTSGCPVHNIIPDWNDLVYHQQWRQALDVLHATNNFPEFTGRVCPAPCEAACTLNINSDAVGIKSIEHAIIEHAWQQGWVLPQPPKQRTGKRVAVIGSGPAGLACAQQLARAGHAVTVFEKNERAGGLLRFGIPDFKLDKAIIDRRISQMEAEGVSFQLSTYVGDAKKAPSGLSVVTPKQLKKDFDAIVLAGGAEQARDLPIPGRELPGVHFAMDFLTQQNRVNAGARLADQISAHGKHVVVIGGGDTGSDCVGTSNRQGAASVTQIELMPRPPEAENKSLSWPYWPAKLRTSSSHEEGCERDWAISSVAFEGDGKVESLLATRVTWQADPVTGQMKMKPVDDTTMKLPADLVLLAMGFVSPVPAVLSAFAVDADGRGNVVADTEQYRTSVDKVFAAGDIRRGQSLVVWAIREGRQCAQSVDAWLMGESVLPR